MLNNITDIPIIYCGDVVVKYIYIGDICVYSKLI